MIESVGHKSQINYIEEGLKYPKNVIHKVLTSYTGYVKYSMQRRFETTFLGLVVFKNAKMSEVTERETYGYQVRVVADEIGESPIMVKSILDYLRDMIKTDVKIGVAYVIYTLCKIGISPDNKLSLRASAVTDKSIRIRATNRFRYSVNNYAGA